MSLDLSLCVMVESRVEKDGERETKQRAWTGSQLDMDMCSRKVCTRRTGRAGRSENSSGGERVVDADCR